MTAPQLADVSDHSELTRLFGVLWPGDGGGDAETVYWLLDGARDPGILAALELSGLECRCLYSGELTARLRAAAPWLVRLDPGASASRALLRQGWGEAWGIVLTVPDSLSIDVLRRHCKKFLRVRTEDHRTLMFRYYDPRVLSVFLPTCDAGQYRALFGPIKQFIVEQRPGAGWQIFRSPE